MKRLVWITVILLIISNSLFAEVVVDEQSDGLAKRIGQCEATNVIFINVQETAAITIKNFISEIPDELKMFYQSDELLFKRTAMIQRIQNDTFETSIPETLAAFAKVDAKRFQNLKQKSFDETMNLWLLSLQKVNPIDQEQFGTKLENAVLDCDSEFQKEIFLP